MNQTPNVQPPTSNAELLAAATTSNSKHQKSYILWRILDFILAGVFIFAGLSKMFDLDHVVADLLQLRFGDALVHFRQLSLAGPVEFANGIDNFKLVPWPVS